MVKPNVLFLCTGNSCRSQMAEGWARHLHGHLLRAHSAGVEPHGMNSYAIRAMQEAGVDISLQHSKHVDELKDIPVDLVITVCGHANETCPVLPGAPLKIHAGFDDPPRLAKDARDDAERMVHYRRVRDEIKEFVEQLPAVLEEALKRRNQE